MLNIILLILSGLLMFYIVNDLQLSLNYINEFKRTSQIHYLFLSTVNLATAVIESMLIVTIWVCGIFFRLGKIGDSIEKKINILGHCQAGTET